MLDIIGLADRQKGRVSKFSGGMKRRLNIGIALLHRPQVLILDEPTVGIDPQSRRNILDSVKELNRAGMTVLYTTHYMEEAQELSDHIAIMDQGEIIACGTHDELVKIVGELDRIDLTLNAPAERVADAWRAMTASTSHRNLTQAGGPDGTSPCSSTTATSSCPPCSSRPTRPACASPPSRSRNPTWRRCSCT